MACLEEMSLLFACLKKNDFDQGKCSTEVAKLQGCFKDFRVSKDLMCYSIVS